MAELIERREYLDFLIRQKDKKMIKVISGVRRCGKSTLFDLYICYLLSHGIDQDQIIDINFEDIKNEALNDYHVLYETVMKRRIPGRMTYVFLDEIQNCKGYEKAVDSLYIQENMDLYITGSNAYFMSGELATLLSGRYVEIGMLPLSFREFRNAADPDRPLIDSYNDYLMTSSFPYALQYRGHQQDVNEFLRGLYTTILLKDVVSRNQIRNVEMLEDVIRYLFDNIGNRQTSGKLAGYMTAHHRKIDDKTVDKYIQALKDALIFYQAKRYDIKGKQILETESKYYAVDIGLRYMLLGYQNTDRGHILENIIFLELKRRGYEVFIGQSGKNEIDFVALKNNAPVYIQVTETVHDQSTLQRELKPLQDMKNHYQKMILTLDNDLPSDYDGIQVRYALDWLIEE
jgi:predicted AAA+ superfamily ATPase